MSRVAHFRIIDALILLLYVLLGSSNLNVVDNNILPV